MFLQDSMIPHTACAPVDLKGMHSESRCSACILKRDGSCQGQQHLAYEVCCLPSRRGITSSAAVLVRVILVPHTARI